jgi:hypothetical protein
MSSSLMKYSTQYSHRGIKPVQATMLPQPTACLGGLQKIPQTAKDKEMTPSEYIHLVSL